MYISFTDTVYKASVCEEGDWECSEGKIGEIFCTVYNMLKEILAADETSLQKYALLQERMQSFWVTANYQLTLRQAFELFENMQISYQYAQQDDDEKKEYKITDRAFYGLVKSAPLFLDGDKPDGPFPHSFESCLTNNGLEYIPHGLEDVVALDLYYSIRLNKLRLYAPCDYCGRLFVKKKGARFCSDSCRLKHGENAKNPYEKITRRLQKQYNAISHTIADGPRIYEDWYEYTKNRTKQVNLLIDCHKDSNIPMRQDSDDLYPNRLGEDIPTDEEIGFPVKSNNKMFGDFPIYYERELIPIPSEQVFEQDLRAYWKKLCK